MAVYKQKNNTFYLLAYIYFSKLTKGSVSQTLIEYNWQYLGHHAVEWLFQ